MKTRCKKILFVLIILVLNLLLINQVFAEPGTVTIAKCAENPDYSPFCKNVYTGSGDDFSEFDDDTYSENYVQLDFSTDKMQKAILSAIGTPEANVFVLLLFSFAALLQIARVITGQGDWISFVIRVLVILAFLRAFSVLFSGVESFFAYLSDQILQGQTAFDVLWKSQIMILKKFSVDFGSMWDMLSWDTAKQVFKDSISVFILTLSYIFAYAIYICIYVVQNCIIIGLKYLGPLLIALAIIPEIDFSEGYIKSLFQVFSWTLIMAILIKIMATIPKLSMANNIGPSDFITISAMNICFGLCFAIVPKISEMVFTGSGFASAGMAVTKFAAQKLQSGFTKGVPAAGKALLVAATFGKAGGAAALASSGAAKGGASGSADASSSSSLASVGTTKNPMATQKSNHHVDSPSTMIAARKKQPKTDQDYQSNYEEGAGV